MNICSVKPQRMIMKLWLLITDYTWKSRYNLTTYKLICVLKSLKYLQIFLFTPLSLAFLRVKVKTCKV
jgi:hypothetical protein